MTCPKCGSDRVFPSRQTAAFEQLLGAFSLYPCRCHKCEYRYLRLRYFILKAGETDPADLMHQNREWPRTIRLMRLAVLFIVGMILVAAVIGWLSQRNI